MVKMSEIKDKIKIEEELKEELATILLEFGEIIFNSEDILSTFTACDQDWRELCKLMDIEEYSDALKHFYEYELQIRSVYKAAYNSQNIPEH